MIKRQVHEILLSRLREECCFIQVLTSPIQVGKTTHARQAMEKLALPVHYASADEPALNKRTWIVQQGGIAAVSM